MGLHNLLRHKRHPEIHWHTRVEVGEVAAGDAGDSERLEVNGRHFSEHAGIASELAFPIAVTQNDDRFGAGRIVVRTQCAPHGGLRAQRREKLTSDVHPANSFKVTVDAKSNIGGRVRKDSRKYILHRADLLEHRIRKGTRRWRRRGSPRTTWATAETCEEIRTRSMARRPLEQDESLWIGHWQVAQRYRINQAKNSGIRPDTEGQRKDDNRREPWPLTQHP